MVEPYLTEKFKLLVDGQLGSTNTKLDLSIPGWTHQHQAGLKQD